MLQVVLSVRRSWRDQRSIPIAYRLGQLRELKRMLDENGSKFEEALWKDLKKVPFYIMENT